MMFYVAFRDPGIITKRGINIARSFSLTSDSDDEDDVVLRESQIYTDR